MHVTSLTLSAGSDWAPKSLDQCNDHSNAYEEYSGYKLGFVWGGGGGSGGIRLL